MEQIKIDLVPSGVTPIAHASQFDIGRDIRFNLLNGGTAYTLAGTETITIEMVKPDASEVTISLTNTSSTYVDWTTSDGELDLDGVYSAEISITQGSDIIGSKNFLVRVEPDPYNGTNLRIVTVGPSDICTFSPTIAEPLVSVKTTLTPSLTGYTTVNLTRCGVNLWDEEWEVGRFDTTTGENVASTTQIRSKNKFRIKGGVNYYIYIPPTLGRMYCIFYDVNEAVIPTPDVPQATSTSGNSVYLLYEFTAPTNACFMRFYCMAAYGTTYNHDISILYPSNTTPAYHAYTGNAYAIALGDTYYGGTLDVTRGKLTVTHYYDEYDENAGWSAGAGNTYFAVFNQPASKSNTDLTQLCNIAVAGGVQYQTYGKFRAQTNGAIAIGNKNPDETLHWADLTAFKADVALNHIHVCYELATPVEIDLTPVQIAAIVGQNNVFSDTGSTEVKYLTIE